MTTTNQRRKSVKEIFNLTKIDRWFLVQIKEIVDYEEELATAKN
jgi:carbamoyl-phosphate synthase large subunit